MSSFLYQRVSSRKPMAEINVVPFIDVMLVLLVIFMMTVPLLTKEVNVELPTQSAHASIHPPFDPLIVTVDAMGRFYLNVGHHPAQAIEGRRLQQLVTQELTKEGKDSTASEDLKGQSSRFILVRGDKNTRYENIMAAMILLQQAGVQRVGLLTKVNDHDVT